ncbi:MAG: hypothetical protein ACRDNP_02500 [Gaiellaceae bacterium]
MDGRALSAAAGHGGLGWSHAVVGLAILLGILVLGLWGDVAVATMLAGVDAFVAATARLSAHGRRSGGAEARPNGTLEHPRAYRARFRPADGRGQR